MQVCPLSLLSVLFIATTVNAKDGCMRVIGRLVCDNNQTMAKGVEVDLMDLDGQFVQSIFKMLTLFGMAGLFWETDDIMGKTWSSTEDGTFTVAGCGSDAGPWNTVDPYLKMTHSCR